MVQEEVASELLSWLRDRKIEEGLLDCMSPPQFRRNQRGDVTMSVELIVTGVALVSACILLAHAIEAYRAH